MASRRGARPVRFLLLLALLLALALLLELQRFLPGSWPGGGGPRGLRAIPEGSAPDPSSVRPSDERPRPPGPGATVLVVVAPPSAGLDPAGRLTVERSGRSTTAPLEGGRAAIEAGDGAIGGFSVERGDRRVVHGAPPPNLGASIVLHWPRATLPETAPAPPLRRTVRVEDEDGRPIAGAEVSWVAGRKEAHGVTDAAGTVEVADTPLPQVRVCAVADGHGEVCAYASVAVPGPLVLRLPRLERRTTTFVDETSGDAVRPVTIRLVTPREAPRTVTRPEEGYGRFDLRLPRDLAWRAAVEVETPGRPTVRVPLSTMGERTPIPRGRTLSVRVVDAAGRPAPGVPVTARYAQSADPEAQDEGVLATSERTDAEGLALVAVPSDRPADLLVVPARGAPTGVRVAVDAPAEVAVRLEPGVTVEVRVTGATGAPLAGARVLCVARAGAGEARREARTGPDGRATLEPVAAGRVEVLAHAPGHAWAAVRADAREGAPPVAVALQAGRRLHLVVEDPWGVPLADVVVRAVPRPGAGGQGPDAGDPDAVPWRTDAHGVLDVADQPARPIDLHLHREGYEDEVVADVTPGDVTWYATLVPVAR
jgi:hypothetical protein